VDVRPAVPFGLDGGEHRGSDQSSNLHRALRKVQGGGAGFLGAKR
jgi:hypothetical protein